MKLRRPQNVHPCGSNQPPSGGCVLKLSAARKPAPTTPPAAFGRLCVETNRKIRSRSNRPQPPSGGCVLKHAFGGDCPQSALQPPSGGCVLKLIFRHFVGGYYIQPPSGGCVLKLVNQSQCLLMIKPAAFGRLCVETGYVGQNLHCRTQPPSGGCVLKPFLSPFLLMFRTSRLRAAVC